MQWDNKIFIVPKHLCRLVESIFVDRYFDMQFQTY